MSPPPEQMKQGRERGTPARSWVLTLIRYLIALVTVYWLVRSGTVNMAILRQSLTSLDVLALAMAILLVALTVTSWRLVILLRARGFEMTLRDALRLNLVGNLFNLVLPSGGGDLARLYYASANAPGRRAELAAVIVFDRVVGLIALLLLPALLVPLIPTSPPASPLLNSLFTAAAVTAMLLMLGLLLVMGPPTGVWTPITWALQRAPYSEKLTQFVEVIRAYRSQPSVLAEVILVSLGAHLLAGVVIAVVHSANGVFVVSAGVIAMLGFVANSLPLTPGGIGVGEAAFSALFRDAGLSGGAEAILSWRLLLITLAPVGLLIHLRGLRLNVAARRG